LVAVAPVTASSYTVYSVHKYTFYIVIVTGINMEIININF